MQVTTDPEDKDCKVVEIKAFTDLDVTTMTCGVTLANGNLILETVLWMLPITRVPPIENKKKKIRIPFIPGKPGAIITLRYKDVTRGLKRSAKESSFNHAVTVDMCGSTKSMCVKLSPGAMHICGATSKEKAEEIVQLLLNKLKIAQQTLELIRDYPTIMGIVAKYVEEITRSNTLQQINEKIPLKPGASIYVVKPTVKMTIKRINAPTKDEFTKELFKELKTLDIQKSDVKLVLSRATVTATSSSDSAANTAAQNIISDKKLVIKTNKEPAAILSLLDGKDDGLVTKIYQAMVLMHSQHEEFDYHYQLHQKLKWILRVPSFFQNSGDIMCVNPEIKMSHFKTYMINYNFSLSFPVNRYELARSLHNNAGFLARYDNAADHQVTVVLPLDLKDPEEKARKKNTIDKITWLIHRSGRVTMSTPTNNDIASDAYEQLMRIIAGSIDKIVGMVPPKKGKHKSDITK